MRELWLTLIAVSCLLVGCRGGGAVATDPQVATADLDAGGEDDSTTGFGLTSPAFAQGDPIPVVHTCDGDDLSPALQWSDPPTGTESLALICDDPDAPMGTWVHWVVVDLPASARELGEGIASDKDLPDGSIHGRNSWKRADYGGPCPPGGTHRYFFHLYALDARLALGSGATKDQVLRAMEGHVLAEAELMGTYQR